jgi:AraC-like DNA-binding protein
MELMEIKEHQKCFNYTSSERQSIEVKTMAIGEVWETTALQNYFLFVMEGNVEITVECLRTKKTRKGSFLFAPACEPLQVYAQSSVALIIVRTGSLASLCDCLRLEQLYQSQKEDTIEANSDELYTGIILPSLWHYLKGVYMAVLDGIQCWSYFETKIKELQLLLRTYYSKQELYLIFFPALTNDIVFSDVVKNSWQKYKTIEDLAEAMNLTPSSFYRHFQKTFGCSARDWIREQKKLLVYKELIHNNTNLKEMADKYWFSSVSSFNNWCVKVYGDSPGDMRKKLHDSRI